MAGEVQNSALVPLLDISYKLKVKCLETATSQSTLTLCVIVTSIPFMGQTGNCIIFFAQATHYPP